MESKKRTVPQTNQRQNQKPISEMLPSLLLKSRIDLPIDSFIHFCNNPLIKKVHTKHNKLHIQVPTQIADKLGACKESEITQANKQTKSRLVSLSIHLPKTIT